jgi:3-oxoacyl-[acyl-carrier-protein] synthase-3
MNTDSESLLAQGVSAATGCFGGFLGALGWRRDEIGKTICHQVGRAHRKALFAALELDTRGDFSTLEYLGNTGSAALPITAAIAAQRGHLQEDDHVAFLGIGSGINVVMLGFDWRTCPVGSADSRESSPPDAISACQAT